MIGLGVIGEGADGGIEIVTVTSPDLIRPPA